jgi:hypothetical protein
MRGPIDYIIVGFDGHRFDGTILKALTQAIDKKIINLVALSAVAKDKKGDVSIVNFADMGDRELMVFSEKYTGGAESFTAEDIDEVSALMDAETTAGVLVVEQVWAKPLKKAIIEANGYLIAEGRIHPEEAHKLDLKEGGKNGFT